MDEEKAEASSDDIEEDEVKGLKALLGTEEKALNVFIEKSKDKQETSSWLKKAHKHERLQDYKKALDSYLKFIEGKLTEMENDPHSTLKAYLSMVGYYLKVAECYEKVTHTSAGGKERDMENAGKYYLMAGNMLSEMEKYEEAFKYYEKSAMCYAEVESFRNAATPYIQAGLMQYKLNKKRMACTAFTKAAEYYEKAEDYANASKAYIKTAELNLEIKDIYGAINSYEKTAECFDKMDRPKQAIKFYIKSAEMSSSLGRYSEVAGKYEKIAKSNERLEDYETAIYYHLRAGELNAGNDDLATSYSFENAARDYSLMENYEDSINHFKKAIAIRVKLKKYAEAASASNEAGGVYEKIGDTLNAANMYFQYAEYQGIVEKESTGEGYKKAAKILEKSAKTAIEENKYEEAIQHYREATKSYDRMNDVAGSAEIYVKMGDIEFERNYDNSIKFYLEAAERYRNGKDSSNAARCFILAKDYLNAAKNYRKYAQEMVGSADFFHGGDGYLRAASAYRKLKKEKEMLNCYSKSVHNYLQYLERAEYVKSDDPGVNAGIANKRIAECYMELGDGPKSQQYFETALEYFHEKQDKIETKCTEALLTIVKTELNLKIGVQEGALEMLNKSLTLLEESVKETQWPAYYQEFLDHNIEHVNELKGRMEIKPDIELTVEQPPEALERGSIHLRATLKNTSSFEVNNIYFLTNFPQEFDIDKEPENIEKMDKQETCEITLDARINMPGKYNFAPLEILYRDKAGNKYMKASNDITLQIK